MSAIQPNAPSKPPVVLTIAGFDPSSGAGVTADLQVFAAHGLFGTAAITALTVQSTLGVAGVQPVEPELLRSSLHHLTQDLPPAGIKIGMLGNAQVVHIVADFLRTLSDVVGDQRIPVVLDPVLKSSSNAALLEADAVKMLLQELVPLVSVITPNLKEAKALSNALDGSDDEPIELIGKAFPRLHVVVTCGDEQEPIDHWRSPDGVIHEFRGSRVETSSTHGTGCAFSSALLSKLVLGVSMQEAIRSAKPYVEGALKHAPGLGQGAGPMDLLWPLRNC